MEITVKIRGFAVKLWQPYRSSYGKATVKLWQGDFDEQRVQQPRKSVAFGALTLVIGGGNSRYLEDWGEG